MYRFAGIRRVLTELEADNWKHRSNYTVTVILNTLLSFWPEEKLLFTFALQSFDSRQFVPAP